MSEFCKNLKDDLVILIEVKRQFDNDLANGPDDIRHMRLLQKNIAKQIFWLGKSLRIAGMDTDEFESKMRTADFTIEK